MKTLSQKPHLLCDFVMIAGVQKPFEEDTKKESNFLSGYVHFEKPLLLIVAFKLDS